MLQMDTVTALTPATSKPAAAGLIDVRLTEVAPAARDTNLFTFRRIDGAPLPPYQPGAHIDLHLQNGLVRQFSLVVPDSDSGSYMVGVKRDTASRGGSRYIFDHMKV